MDIIEKHKLLTALIEKKIGLESALDYMRKEEMLCQYTARYERKYYAVAVSSMEKELKEVLEEISRIEKEG